MEDSELVSLFKPMMKKHLFLSLIVTTLPQVTYELNVTGINTLIFDLNYSNGVSVPFGFYDMTVVN